MFNLIKNALRAIANYEKKNAIKFTNIRDNLKLTKNITIHANFKKEKNHEFYLKVNNNYTHDFFADELALSINTDNGPIVVTGCAHSGIINILDKIILDNKAKNIYALLGGFHLMDLKREEAKQVAEKINSYHINMIGISHYTDNKIARYLKNTKVFNFDVGDHFIC